MTALLPWLALACIGLLVFLVGLLWVLEVHIWEMRETLGQMTRTLDATHRECVKRAERLEGDVGELRHDIAGIEKPPEPGT